MENRPKALHVLQGKPKGAPGPRRIVSRRLLPADERRGRALFAFAIASLLVGVAFLPLGTPLSLFSLHTCAFKGITGLPCPLCGGTRAMQALLHGDLVAATSLNIAALPALVALVTLTLILFCEAACARAILDWNAILGGLRSLLPILIAVFCVYWLLHLASAVRSMKPELVNLDNPIARAVCNRFSHPQD